MAAMEKHIERFFGPCDAVLHEPFSRGIHVDAGGRDYPYEGDGYDYVALFEALKAAGYEGRVSIEAGCKDFAVDSKKAFAVLDAARKA